MKNALKSMRFLFKFSKNIQYLLTNCKKYVII